MKDNKEKEIQNQNMRIDTSSIHVSISNGEATLDGKVDSLQKKLLAEKNAMQVAGIYKVINKLKVKAETSYTDDVVRSFILATMEDGHQLEIEVVDGRAILKGLVRSYVKRKNIIEIAQHTPGVLEIDNHIELNKN